MNELIIYQIIGGALVVIPFIIRNKYINFALMGVMALMQMWLFWFEYNSIGVTHLVYFNPDSASILVLGLLSIVAVLGVPKSIIRLNLLQRNNRKISEYTAGYNGLIVASSLAFLANHIGTYWVFTEATTLFIGFLIFKSRDIKALEASWKYVFVSTVGLALAFIGIVFLNIATGKNGNEFLFIDVLKPFLAHGNVVWLKLSFIFFVVGYSTKMGLAPLHTIIIDAHGSAPSPVSSLLSGTLLNLGVLAIYRILLLMQLAGLGEWASRILIISGVLSLIIPAIYMLNIKYYKRMLAYSSIEHMGLIAIMMGIGAYKLMFLHMIFHGLIKSSLFFSTESLFLMYRSKKIENIKGLMVNSPVVAMVFLLGFLAISGLPPFGIFFTELNLFTVLFASNHWMLAIAIMLLITLIIAGTIVKLIPMLFSKYTETNYFRKDIVKNWHFIPEIILLALAIYIAIFPPPVLLDLLSKI